MRKGACPPLRATLCRGGSEKEGELLDRRGISGIFEPRLDFSSAFGCGSAELVVCVAELVPGSVCCTQEDDAIELAVCSKITPVSRRVFRASPSHQRSAAWCCCECAGCCCINLDSQHCSPHPPSINQITCPSCVCWHHIAWSCVFLVFTGKTAPSWRKFTAVPSIAGQCMHTCNV